MGFGDVAGVLRANGRYAEYNCEEQRKEAEMHGEESLAARFGAGATQTGDSLQSACTRQQRRPLTWPHLHGLRWFMKDFCWAMHREERSN